MPSWKKIASSWFFRVFQALKGLAGVFDQHAARRSFWMWRPDASNTSRHTADQRRCRTMSYDVIRCQQSAGNVALEKPDFTRNGVRNGLQNVENCKTSPRSRQVPWISSCEKEKYGKIFLLKLCVVSFCEVLQTLHLPHGGPTWWWVKGLVWTCRCLKGGVTSTREKSLVHPPVTRLT